MAFSYVDYSTVYAAGSGNDMDFARTLNVQAHDVLVAWISWESGASVPHIWDKDDHSNAFTMQDTIIQSTTTYGALGVLLDAAAKNPLQFEANLETARSYRAALILQFRPDAGDTVSLDGVQVTGTGSVAPIYTGTKTTVGTDEILVAGATSYNATALTEWKFGPAGSEGNADGHQDVTYNGIWYKILTATQTDWRAYGYWNSTGDSVIGMVAIKAVAGVAPSFKPAWGKNANQYLGSGA